MPIEASLSSDTYQNLDGSNFSLQGFDGAYKTGNCSIGGFVGLGTGFKKNTTSLVADVKGAYKYNKTPISSGFRLRHSISGESKNVQLRLQPTDLNIPVGKKTNWYTTPYITAKYDYNSGKIKTESGIFSGLSFKSGYKKRYIEVQLYDFKNINNSTIGINAGMSIPL